MGSSWNISRALVSHCVILTKESIKSADRCYMPEDAPTTVPFHYIKGNFFRVIHADGAIGSVTPAGLIFVSLYSERAAIPQIMVHEITETGQVGSEHLEERVAKKGIVREVEIGAMMSIETAASIVKWLQEKIDLVQKLKNTAEAEKVGKHAPVH